MIKPLHRFGSKKYRTDLKILYIQNSIYYVAWSYQLFVINTCVSNAAFADKRSSCVLGKSVSVLLGKRPTDFAQICWSTTVTQLPIRNCRERSNIFDAKWRKLNAIDVTQKTMHERLLLVSGPLSTAFLWSCSWRPHSHHFTLPLILEINQSSLKGATFGKNLFPGKPFESLGKAQLRTGWGDGGCA